MGLAIGLAFHGLADIDHLHHSPGYVPHYLHLSCGEVDLANAVAVHRDTYSNFQVSSLLPSSSADMKYVGNAPCPKQLKVARLIHRKLQRTHRH